MSSANDSKVGDIPITIVTSEYYLGLEIPCHVVVQMNMVIFMSPSLPQLAEDLKEKLFFLWFYNVLPTFPWGSWQKRVWKIVKAGETETGL